MTPFQCIKAGESGCALACAEAGTLMGVSQHANTTLEDIAATCNAPRWYQLYILKDRQLTEALLRRAEAAGYNGICLTVDSARFGYREADARNGFTGIDDRGLSLPNYPTQAGVADREREAWDQNTEKIFDAGAKWADVAWLKSLTTLPLIIKGERF
jgi:isopentenyl diphosphate isomerase/L-lactate dehydrogenase-like FMN-dependent dehydrogenase